MLRRLNPRSPDGPIGGLAACFGSNHMQVRAVLQAIEQAGMSVGAHNRPVIGA